MFFLAQRHFAKVRMEMKDDSINAKKHTNIRNNNFINGTKHTDAQCF